MRGIGSHERGDDSSFWVAMTVISHGLELWFGRAPRYHDSPAAGSARAHAERAGRALRVALVHGREPRASHVRRRVDGHAAACIDRSLRGRRCGRRCTRRVSRRIGVHRDARATTGDDHAHAGPALPRTDKNPVDIWSDPAIDCAREEPGAE
jgi:hypothetical protein